MDITYYTFAFYVFILVCLAIVLVKKVGNTNTKEDKVFQDKEKRLFKLYQNLEDMISSTEEFIEESRRDIANDKKKITNMLEKMDILYQETQNDMKKKTIEKKVTTKSVKNKKGKNADEDTRAIENMSKNELVKHLKAEGLNIEQISKKLGISHGEVALIIGLNR